jgi:nucleoside-diphosphate-sugar epimerase
MKIFLAGATGVIGARLLPRLVSRGDNVVALTRDRSNVERLTSHKVEVVVGDALDRDQMVDIMTRARPDVVIHELTALRDVMRYRNFDREFARTNKLRTAGTENLMAGAKAAGARRFIAQSYGGWTYERAGSAIKTEDDPLDPMPPRQQRISLDAIRRLEHIVTLQNDMVGIALRYGAFYGPGTNMAPGGQVWETVRKRGLPVVGDGNGVWSFLHIDDAATATIAAIDRGATGVYNICDDDPAPASVWIPALAEIMGAKPPMHVWKWLGRMAAGDVGVSMMTQIRGMSNAKARRDLNWQPRYASWRNGFRELARAVRTRVHCG